ncbi:MAG: hypothetical protein ACKN9V_00800 [Pseudomonadota bacterium]
MKLNALCALLALILTPIVFGSGLGDETPGILKKVETSEPGKLVYDCEIRTRLKDVKLRVSLQTRNAFMEAYLDEDVRVKGYASETFDKKSGNTFYFLQGGSAPYFQQLTLVIREGGQWAEFRKTYGGTGFRCNLE